jgi:Flp pilus assembly protein TadG
MATLEFALVVPVLIVLIIGALDFSRLIVAYTTITNASREGARYAVLHPAAPASEIQREVQQRSSPLSANDLSVVIKVQQAGGTPQDWSRAFPTRTPSDAVVTVTVSYPWRAASALTGGFFASRSPALESTASLEMRR